MSRVEHLIVALLALFVHTAAMAHKPSDSYLTLEVHGNTVDGQWDIALRDLDFAIGLDANQDSAITWSEVKAKHADIAAYALSRLTLGPRESPCVLTPRDHLIDNHSDGAYEVLRFTAACAAPPKVLEVAYRLFFEIDPQHRGLLNLATPSGNRAGIFSNEAPVQRFVLTDVSRAEQAADYTKEGVLHIWTGFDHVLFLLCLLLPAVLVRSVDRKKAWSATTSFRAAFWDVFKVVTAFTVAHSITLSLAALGVIALPSRVVESTIAASIVLAALNNVRPVVYGGRWAIAFCFGLIHGFGFASVLIDLGLPQSSLLLALVSFNVGVELGQIAIVAAFLPMAYALRDTLVYRRAIFVGGSLVVTGIATLWLVERAFNVALVPAFGS